MDGKLVGKTCLLKENSCGFEIGFEFQLRKHGINSINMDKTHNGGENKLQKHFEALIKSEFK